MKRPAGPIFTCTAAGGVQQVFAKGSGKDICDILGPVQEFSTDCKLFGGIGKGLNDQLERNRAQCLQESQLGLQ